MPFCNICKFQVFDGSVSTCPNCGAPMENAGGNEESVEQTSSSINNQYGNGNQDPTAAECRADEDDLQICDPGDLLCAEQYGGEPARESRPIGQTEPQMPSPVNDEDGNDEEPEKPESSRLKKLSDEQVNNIRSKLINGEDSEYVSAQDASSIIHDLSRAHDGPALQRNNSESNSNDSQKSMSEPMPPVHNQVSSTSDSTGLLPTPTAAPMRKIAYFHKNFIQLTGSVYPTSGEEMTIDDRHYLLKQKKIKPQYTIGVFSVLVALLLFIIGKQFISPTLPGSGSIIGVILDDGGRPIATGVEISLPESGKKVTSDAIGFFKFDNVPTGVYVVQYSLPDGRIGSEKISVANEDVSILSLSADEAVARFSAGTDAESQETRTNSVHRQETGRNMPPIPEEQKQQAEQQSNAKKEYSSLKLNANVDEAKLTINGEVLGAGNMTYKKLGPGEHKAKVSKTGYKAWTGTVTLKPNETYSLSVNLEKLSTESDEPVYSAEDFYQSGRTMLADGDIDAAVQDLSEAIRIKPAMADAYISRAEAYTLARKTKLAEADFIRAGEIYDSQKRTESALGCFNRALEIDDQSVAAYLNRGDLYRRMDYRENALEDFQNAVKYDKENPRANFELGKMYFSVGNYKDADKRLRKARDLDPRNPEVYHYLMLNYFARDDFGKVKETYGNFKQTASEDQQQAFKENPKFDAILRIVGEYERP